jgi:hypothetical protein
MTWFGSFSNSYWLPFAAINSCKSGLQPELRPTGHPARDQRPSVCRKWVLVTIQPLSGMGRDSLDTSGPHFMAL